MQQGLKVSSKSQRQGGEPFDGGDIKEEEDANFSLTSFQNHSVRQFAYFDGVMQKFCELNLKCSQTLSPLDAILLAEDIDTTGHTVWIGAEVLAHFICCYPEYFQDKLVCELGSGTGLAGLVAAKFSKRWTFLTDKDTEILKLLSENAYLNNNGNTARTSLVSIEEVCYNNDTAQDIPCSPNRNPVVVSELAWGNQEHIDRVLLDLSSNVADESTNAATASSKSCGPGLASSPQENTEWHEKYHFDEAHQTKFDVVIAADVIYSAEILGPLWRTMQCLTKENGIVFLSHVPRCSMQIIHDLIIHKASQRGFILQQVHLPSSFIHCTGSNKQQEAKYHHQHENTCLLRGSSNETLELNDSDGVCVMQFLKNVGI